MSYESFISAYAGIGSQLDANVSLTISLADNAITFVPIYLAKKEAFLKEIQYDVQQYLLATLDFADKNANAKAAQWNEKKSLDTSMMDAQTGNINTLIENFKSDAEANEVDLQTAIGMQEPMNKYLKSLVNLLANGPNT